MYMYPYICYDQLYTSVYLNKLITKCILILINRKNNNRKRKKILKPSKAKIIVANNYIQHTHTHTDMCERM